MAPSSAQRGSSSDKGSPFKKSSSFKDSSGKKGSSFKKGSNGKSGSSFKKVSDGKKGSSFKKGSNGKDGSSFKKSPNDKNGPSFKKDFKKGGGSRKREITFDPEARRDYLRGFSERKKERRAYGLAMQKVKDRNARLEERKETKIADLERIQQAEQEKKALLRDSHGLSIDDDDDDGSQDNEANAAMTVMTFQDVATQSQFGGQVIVTTSTMPPSDDSDNDEATEPSAKKIKTSVDRRQRYAGDVNKFLNELKGKMPGKKRDGAGAAPKHKGKHGATSMKGMGGAANLKLAAKALSTMQAKTKGAPGGAGDRHKGKGGKRKR